MYLCAMHAFTHTHTTHTLVHHPPLTLTHTRTPLHSTPLHLIIRGIEYSSILLALAIATQHNSVNLFRILIV
jgi:hypothetical protein